MENLEDNGTMKVGINLPLYDGLKDTEQIELVTDLYNVFSSGGYFSNDKESELKRVVLKDLLTSAELSQLVPNVIQQITYDAAILNLHILPSLFRRIALKEGTQQLVIQAIGEVQAGMISEGGEYPEAFPSGTHRQTIRIITQKYGLKLSVTDEALSAAPFDVLNMWLNCAGRALARIKEQRAATMLCEEGLTIFDNGAPGASERGCTTGRDISGIQNGSMTYDDLYEMYIYQRVRRFEPDTLLINPLAYRIFIKDQLTMEMLQNGAHWNNILGNPAPGWGTTFQGLGYRTTATGRSTPGGTTSRIGASPWVTTLNPLGATFYTQPQYGPFGNMRVIVSPFVPFTENGGQWTDKDGVTHTVNTCHILMIDSTRCGIFVEAQGIRNDEWDDPERDIRYTKLSERWGMNILEQGKGVSVAFNVNVTPNYLFDNANTVTLSPLSNDIVFAV